MSSLSKVVFGLSILLPMCLLLVYYLRHWTNVRHASILMERLQTERLSVSQNGKKGFHADEILPNFLYLGSFPSSLQFDEMKSRNITHVISVIREVVIPPLVASEISKVKHLKVKFADEYKNISYLHIKAIDFEHQNLLDYFDEAHEFIEQAKAQNGSVLIHWYEMSHIIGVNSAYSMAGVSRSTTIVLSYIMKHLDRSLKEALTMVKKVIFVLQSI